MATSLLHYKNITLDKVLQETDKPRKTKIICTIGPSCNSIEKLTQLINAGMTVARLNFSHGDHESHRENIRRIREAVKLCPGKMVAILLDTKGPEVRTGFLENPSGVFLEKGSEVEIVTDYTMKGNATKFACSYKDLPKSVAPGNTILAADGSLVMKVVECRETSVVVRMINGGKLGERKNMNLPGNKVNLPVIGPKDEDDLRSFAKEIDFVAASFVQHGTDIDLVRNGLGKDGANVKVIAKIENQEGLQNFDQILETFDAIMVARGDLGMEIPMEKVFLAQKMLIRKSNVYGKPVITATQMLESMTKNPRPTRAESTDVANAVLDGSDCCMLSGETAGGDYPIESVTTMASICREAENVINHEKLFQALVNSMKYEIESKAKRELTETIAMSTVKAGIDANARLIVIISENGEAARLVAKFRPPGVILVLTGNEQLARQLHGIVSGVYALVVDRKLTVQAVLNKGFDYAKQRSWVAGGDYVVVLKRTKSKKHGYKHMMEVNTIPEEESE